MFVSRAAMALSAGSTTIQIAGGFLFWFVMIEFSLISNWDSYDLHICLKLMNPLQPISEAWVESHEWWKIGFLFFIIWATIDSWQITYKNWTCWSVLQAMKNLEDYARAQDCQWCIRVRKVNARCCYTVNHVTTLWITFLLFPYKLRI